MDPVETYIQELRQIHSTGAAVPETSYYGAVAGLLNAVGGELRPRVCCVVNIHNQGAGIPDGGFFAADQLQGGVPEELLPGQLPARGAVEVKGPGQDLAEVAQSDQVAGYRSLYGQVLLCNLREFALLGCRPGEHPAVLETYSLAASEAELWAAAMHPRQVANAHGDRLTEHLKRALLHPAPLAEPAGVAWFLASYAREARARIEGVDLPALHAVRRALEESLGIRFEGEKGDHFFRSTLVQTLFYGVFSAWVLWCKEHPPLSPERFDWRLAVWSLRVPMIGALFEQIAQPSTLGPLRLVEVLDWAGDALNRVDRPEFFARFEEGHAVQYFYEPFLEAFDPELRKELGVWYTPPEIVQYMVARVDSVLREELGIADGLAADNVYVLDPCCGTGAYLVEVLRRIAATIEGFNGDALTAWDVKQAALNRVFGFEILPAPFVIAHLQIGLFLRAQGLPLAERTSERAGVYLTNALTGWEPPEGPRRQLAFPQMQEERDAADRVKREVPILVILGNPPYNGFAGVAVAEERGLSDAYRTTKQAPAPQGQGLNDLYVRFFRMAERRIVEGTGRGVVCFISNYSWLDGLSFTGMRERYLDAFDRIWIDNLHGDRIISEYAPDGRTSETVFAMQGTSPGIKVGTSIALLSRSGRPAQGGTEVRYRDMDQARAADRRAALLQSLSAPDLAGAYAALDPAPEIGLPLKPRVVSGGYFAWPLLPDLLPVSFPGVKTSRDDVVVDVDQERLVERMERYFSPAVSHEEMARIAPGIMASTARFDARQVRAYLQQRGFRPEQVVRYHYRPFDVRWLYWEPETKLLDEKRTDYFRQVFDGNWWLSAGQRNRKEGFYQPQVSRVLADHHIVESNVAMFPLHFRRNGEPRNLFTEGATDDVVPNLTAAASAYLAQRAAPPEALFHHALAVLHSPAYRGHNAGGLRQDWPRMPLPESGERLAASADLGRQVAALLDPEAPVPGVTAGSVRPGLQAVAGIRRIDRATLSPDAGDLALTAGWGHAGKGGVTMPARGSVVRRDYTPGELGRLREGAESLGLSEEEALACLGRDTVDVYLNEVAYWENVPARVWEYTIGGYQVLKKWLSYRERPLLGRDLSPDEVREVTSIARRIAALLLLEPALDANYNAVKADTYPWPGPNA